MTSPTIPSEGALRQEWERALDCDGVQAVPNLPIERQASLGISSRDLGVLLHLTCFWWTPDRDPHPRPGLIADQMGLHRRTVERSLQRIEQKGLVTRKRADKTDGHSGVFPVSLAPLANRLTAIADSVLQRRRIE